MVRNIIAHYCIVWFICVWSTKGEKPSRCGIQHRLRFLILLLAARVEFTFLILLRLTHRAYTKRCKVEIGSHFSLSSRIEPEDAFADLTSISEVQFRLHIFHTYNHIIKSIGRDLPEYLFDILCVLRLPFMARGKARQCVEWMCCYKVLNL